MFSFSVFADNLDYYDQVYLGEEETEDYLGPFYPKLLKNYQSLRHHSYDEKFYEDYVVSSSLGEFQNDKYFKEVLSAFKCSNIDLSNNVKYLRYLYRLITINYIFELINAYSAKSIEYKLTSNECKVDWKSLFNKCTPLSLDMKRFLDRARPHLNRIIGNLSVADKTLVTMSDRVIKNDKLLNFANSYECQDCEISKKINLTCRDLKQEFHNICSETDSIYGVSKMKKLQDSLSKSSVLSSISGNGTQCLERYVKLFKAKENYSKRFVQGLKISDKMIKSNNKDLVQGRIFIYGALKEFDEKGLVNLLYTPVKRKAVDKEKPLHTPNSTPKIVRKVDRRVPPAKKEAQVVRKVERKPKAPIKKKSLFEMALAELKESKKEIVKLSYASFKNERYFNQRVMSFLRDSLKELTTQQALKNMRRFDDLGSREEPVKLSFIKFLIDDENHQGLFNLTLSLGEQFFVINDLDGMEEEVLFELKNNKSTNYQWELAVLK